MKSDPNMIEDLISIIHMGKEKAKTEGQGEYYDLFCKLKSIHLFRLWCEKGDPLTGVDLQERMDELERIIGRLDAKIDPY